MTESYGDIIVEGKASIHTGTNTFYNPVQEFNRDMSVAALTVFAREYQNFSLETTSKRRHDEQKLENPSDNDGITILEALAATGLRSIRFALEVPHLRTIYANDFSSKAVEVMKFNIEKNNVEDIVIPVNHDAIWLMQKFHFENKSIHAIDLDPYGCPTRFLDSAINCVKDGGLLMVTCTDMAVIAGNTPESCFVKYGAISLRNAACHELALRIALHSLSLQCGRYGKYIVPLLSFSADFYIRVFVKVFSSQKVCKQTSSRSSMVYQCVGCNMFTLQPLGVVSDETATNPKYWLPHGPPVQEQCVHCGSKHKIGGPIWNGKLCDSNFVDKMIEIAERNELGTSKRMLGMLSLIKEELQDVPLFYTIDALCAKIHCQVLPLITFRSALLNAGFKISPSHCKANSVKTNAPQTFIWDILRQWVKTNPVSEKRKQTNRVVATILAKEPESNVNFTFCTGAVSSAAANGLLRYQRNPLPYWGPGTRARSNKIFDGQAAKKVRNQNKKSRLREPTQTEVPADVNVENQS